jgi:hypothetical protein
MCTPASAATAKSAYLYFDVVSKEMDYKIEKRNRDNMK